MTDAVGDGSANSTFLFDDIDLYDRTGGKDQIDLPATFEGSTINYELTDFEGVSKSLVANPADATNTVVKTNREAGTAPWPDQ